MKSKKLWLGIGAVVLIVLCMGSFPGYAGKNRLLYADRQSLGNRN